MEHTQDTEARDEKNVFRALTDSMTAQGIFPSCFDSQQQFDTWASVASVMPPSTGLGWCEDCSRGYQAKMLALGRCTRPYVRFNGAEAVMPDEQRIFWLRVARKVRDGTGGIPLV